MAEVHERARQIQLRLVYFGPPRSGKAANLQRIHELLHPETRSRMKAFDVGADRTISFEMTLPVASAGAAAPGEDAWKVSVHVSACSSPLLKPTKVALLEAADAVAFVADGSRARHDENREALREVEDLLRGRARAVPPLVLQMNKRDLGDALSEEEIEQAWGREAGAEHGDGADEPRSARPIFTAAAKQGHGVRETFSCLLRLAFVEADRLLQLGTRTGLSLTAVTDSALLAMRRDADGGSPVAAEPDGASPAADPSWRQRP